MRQRSTNHPENKIPNITVALLRLDRGASARLARRLGKSPSHISKILSGTRRGERVRKAILRESARLARIFGAGSALLELEQAAWSPAPPSTGRSPGEPGRR